MSLLLLAILAPSALAHPSADGVMHPFAEHAQVFVDTDGQLDAQAAIAAHDAGRFRPLEEWETRFGYTDARLWMVLAPPAELANLSRLRMLIEWALLDDVHLIHLRGNAPIAEVHTGAAVPFEARPVPMRSIALPVSGYDTATDRLLLSVRTQGNLAVSGWFTTPDGLAAWSSRQDLLSASFYGAMAALLLLNALLFLLTRVRSLLYYCLFVGATIGHHALSHDTLPTLWPSVAFEHLHEVYLLCVLLSGVAAIMFTRHALVLPRATPRLDQLIQILGTLTAIGAIAIPLLGVTTSYRLAAILALIANPVLIAASAIRWRQGDRSARTLVFAWSVLLIGIMLMAMYRAGILPVAIVTEDDTYLISAVAAMLLSFAIFHRLLLLEQEPATGQAQRFEGLRRSAAEGDRMIDELEQTVRQRNRDLRGANERLEAVRAETERHAQTLNALFTSSVTVHRSEDPDELLEHSLEQLADLFPAHAFGIVVHGDRPGDVRHRAFVRMGDSEERIIVENAQLLGEGVRSTLRSLLLSSVDAAPTTDPNSRQGGWQFLGLGDRTPNARGYLIIRGPDMPDRSLDVLGVFCTQIATALENRRLSAELEELANTDSLTGIGNRKVFEAVIARAIANATSRPSIEFCVLVVDINGLKQVNDRWGHEIGDALIRHVADILAETARREDTVTRTGGDEFVILCPSARMDTGPELAERIHERMRELPLRARSLMAGAMNLQASVSIGMADTRDTAPEDVVSRADIRMYDAKQQHYARLSAQQATAGKGAPGADPTARTMQGDTTAAQEDARES